MRDCIKRIVETSKGAFNKEEAKQFLDELEARANKLVDMNGSVYSFDEVLKQAATDMKFDGKLDTILRQRSILFNEIKSRATSAYIEKTGLGNDRGTLAFFRGTIDNADMGKYSIGAQVDAQINYWNAKLINGLQKAGVRNFVARPESESLIAREIDILNGGNAKPTGSAEAVKAAKVINDIFETQRVLRNKEGAYIKSLRGFVAVQRHNQTRIMAAGKPQWKQDAAPLVDFDRMGIRLQDRDDYLEGMWKSIEDSSIYTPSYNLADKISQRRDLHFIDSDSFLAYNRKYGSGSLMETVALQISQGARQYTMLKNLGTNPIESKNQLVAKVGDESTKIAIERAFDEFSGKADIPVSANLSSVMSTSRAFIGMAKMGFAALNSISDVIVSAVRMQRNGMPVVRAYYESLANVVRAIPGISNKDRLDIAESFGIGMKSEIGAQVSGLSSEQTVPRFVSRAQRFYYKLNGLTWWSEQAMQKGWVATQTNLLARWKDKGFTALPARLQEVFAQYGITEAEWKHMVTSIAKTEGGDEHMTPEFITDPEVKSKFLTYLSDQVSYVTSESDTRTRTQMTQGSRKGTWDGEMWRTMFQFKQFTWNILARQYGDIAYGRGRLDVPALVQLMVGNYIAANASLYLVAQFKGEKFSFDDVDTQSRALARSGIGGYAGDLTLGFMLDNYRYGMKGPLESGLVGPLPEQIDKLAKAVKSQKLKNINKQLLSMLPGKNLYFMPALEYLITQQALGIGSPDWGERVQQHKVKQ